MKRILMVCLGNICRSPLAEGILRKKAEDSGIEIEVDSAGTAAYHVGEHPDPRSMENAASHDIDISQLRARKFTVEDFDEFDEIFAMDAQNYANILALARNERDSEKVSMILNQSNPGSNQSVPDPYYGGEHGFENVYQLLDQACDKIIEHSQA